MSGTVEDEVKQQAPVSRETPAAESVEEESELAAWAKQQPAPLASDNTAAQKQRQSGQVAAANGPAAAPGAKGAATAADTNAWLAAGATYIHGTLLPNMAKEPAGIVKNTAMYCQGNAIDTGKPRVVVEPLVPMHDSDARVLNKRMLPASFTAWAWGNRSDVNIMTKSLGGLHNGRRVGLVTRRDHAGTVWTEREAQDFLIHEIQHDADHHESSKEGAAEKGGFNAGAWRQFETEYRAYWVDRRYNLLSTTKQHTATHPGINGGAAIAGKNEKSFACIKHLWDSGTTYKAIIDAYNASTRFQTLVHQYNDLESANATHDPKIDDFVRSITSRTTGKVLTAWRSLSVAQQLTVQGNGEIRELILSAFGTRHEFRVPLLGFVDGAFSDGDFEQTLSFTKAISQRDQKGTRFAAQNVTANALAFLTNGLSDFRAFVRHYSSDGKYSNEYLLPWSTEDVIGLLQGKVPKDKPQQAPILWGCFAAGTLVLLANGEECRIESIEVGDEVLAYDESHRTVVARPVLACHAHPPEVTLRAYVEGISESLSVTENHRFFLPELAKWVALRDVPIGSSLFHYAPERREASPRRLERIEVGETVPVFNLSISELPSYFAAGILVHNTKTLL